jgi:hypothetical protein
MGGGAARRGNGAKAQKARKQSQPDEKDAASDESFPSNPSGMIEKNRNRGKNQKRRKQQQQNVPQSMPLQMAGEADNKRLRQTGLFSR